MLGLEPSYSFSQSALFPCTNCLQFFNKDGIWVLQVTAEAIQREGGKSHMLHSGLRGNAIALPISPLTAGLPVPSQSKVTLPALRKRGDLESKIEERSGCSEASSKGSR